MVQLSALLLASCLALASCSGDATQGGGTYDGTGNGGHSSGSSSQGSQLQTALNLIDQASLPDVKTGGGIDIPSALDQYDNTAGGQNFDILRNDINNDGGNILSGVQHSNTNGKNSAAGNSKSSSGNSFSNNDNFFDTNSRSSSSGSSSSNFNSLPSQSSRTFSDGYDNSQKDTKAVALDNQDINKLGARKSIQDLFSFDNAFDDKFDQTFFKNNPFVSSDKKDNSKTGSKTDSKSQQSRPNFNGLSSGVKTPVFGNDKSRDLFNKGSSLPTDQTFGTGNGGYPLTDDNKNTGLTGRGLSRVSGGSGAARDLASSKDFTSGLAANRKLGDSLFSSSSISQSSGRKPTQNTQKTSNVYGTGNDLTKRGQGKGLNSGSSLFDQGLGSSLKSTNLKTPSRPSVKQGSASSLFSTDPLGQRSGGLLKGNFDQGKGSTSSVHSGQSSGLQNSLGSSNRKTGVSSADLRKEAVRGFTDPDSFGEDDRTSSSSVRRGANSQQAQKFLEDTGLDFGLQGLDGGSRQVFDSGVLGSASTSSSGGKRSFNTASSSSSSSGKNGGTSSGTNRANSGSKGVSNTYAGF